MAKAMSGPEFLKYWLAPDEDGLPSLYYFEESVAEHEAEYRNECALFGDAGPGMGYRLNEMKRELASVKRRIERLSAGGV